MSEHDRQVAAARTFDQDYPELVNLFCGYFHPYWDSDFQNEDEVVRTYSNEADPKNIEAAIAGLDRLLALTEEKIEETIALSCGYWPKGAGIDYTTWLLRVRELLAGAV